MLDTMMMGEAPFDMQEGAMMSEPKKSKKNNPYPALAEMIRQQGKGEDTILAHINPLEAMMLMEMGGSGKINPTTGLPQFGFFNKPFKAIKSIAGGVGGTILGNMILPGMGGVIGGALGNVIGEKIRGRNNFGQAALKGAFMGATIPTAAGLAGSGASALGMNSAGQALTKYGAENAVMPSLGKLIGDNTVGNYVGSIGQNTGSSLAKEAVKEGAEKTGNSWMSSLMKPKNLLTAATLAGSFLNRPKEKSPEQLADEYKRYQKGIMLNPEERRAQETDLLAEEQMRRRIARSKYLPEDRFEVKPLYRNVNTPADYARTGKWFNYYDNPNFQGNPLLMKEGGMVIDSEEIDYPGGLGIFMQGHTSGQDDKVNARLSHGEFVIPADVVAIAGDGNSNAGGVAFDALVEKMRKSVGRKNELPPKSKDLASYMKPKKQKRV